MTKRYILTYNMRANAYAWYVPGQGLVKAKDPWDASGGRGKGFGAGTETDGNSTVEWYKNNYDYTHGVICVTIYPYAAKPYVQICWKDSRNNNYIGGNNENNCTRLVLFLE